MAPLELIFEVIFSFAFKLTHSEGLSIIILSIVVSTLVLPLYNRAEKIEAEQRAKEKELSHWVEHIKKSFKGDERYMMLDAYYRENNYNPIYQLKSSISILLQIPFFMAAYDLLGIRASSRFDETGFFIFYNLGAPDEIFRVGNITVNALPILMTLISLLTTYIYTKDLPVKTALRSLILPVLFLILLYNCPSSLLLYWTMNNVYSLVKTLILKNRSTDRKKAPNPGRSGKTSKLLKPVFEGNTGTGTFVLSAVFMAVLTGLLIPLAYLSASPEEFISITDPQNPLRYLLSSFFVATGFFIFWPGVFYYLANKKVRAVFSVLMLGVSVASIVNYLFFGTDTGTISTTLVFDKEPSHQLLIVIFNLVLFVAIAVLCIFLFRFKRVIRVIYIAAVMTILTISVIYGNKVQTTYSSVLTNIGSYQEMEGPKIQLTSNGKNVIVIMLDRGISGFVPYVFYEFPEIQAQFDGFVYYPNTISFGQNTLKTSSALFGGYEYTPEKIDARADETLAEKHDESLKVMPALFSEQGYCITLMDLPFAGWSWNHDYSSFEDIDNCFAYHPKDYFSSGTEANVNIENRRNRNMFMYSIFRCSPLFVQNIIYDGGDYLSVASDAYNKFDILENYRVLENMSEMTVVDDNYPGAVLLMDNETTHDVTNISNYDPYSPYEFEDDGYYISDGTTVLYLWDPLQAASYECTVAALRELGNYMQYLQSIGVYDNTRIIIVSDHGNGMYLFDDLVTDDFNAEWYNCMLLVKDFDSTGYTTDYTFMTNADVPVIAMEGLVDNPVNPYTNNPINSDMKYGDLYVGYSLTHDETLWNPDLNQGNTFTYDDTYKWFMLEERNIFNVDSWVQVDKPE